MGEIERTPQDSDCYHSEGGLEVLDCSWEDSRNHVNLVRMAGRQLQQLADMELRGEFFVGMPGWI